MVADIWCLVRKAALHSFSVATSTAHQLHLLYRAFGFTMAQEKVDQDVYEGELSDGFKANVIEVTRLTTSSRPVEGDHPRSVRVDDPNQLIQ